MKCCHFKILVISISHGDNYQDNPQYVRRTVGQRCYGHIDFMTSTEIKSYMTFHYEILECCHFKILMISISPGDNYRDKLDGY